MLPIELERVDAGERSNEDRYSRQMPSQKRRFHVELDDMRDGTVHPKLLILGVQSLRHRRHEAARRPCELRPIRP